MTPRMAPKWHATEWFNTPTPLTLEALRGRVVVLHVFQMRCSGCISRGLPQARRVFELFADAPLSVVGLHAPFERGESAEGASLETFLRAHRISFPVGVDIPNPSGGLMPMTMSAYRMQGTPTTVLIDAAGRLRRQALGPHEDLLLGAEIQTLLLEAQSRKEEALV